MVLTFFPGPVLVYSCGRDRHVAATGVPLPPEWPSKRSSTAYGWRRRRISIRVPEPSIRDRVNFQALTRAALFRPWQYPIPTAIRALMRPGYASMLRIHCSPSFGRFCERWGRVADTLCGVGTTAIDDEIIGQTIFFRLGPAFDLTPLRWVQRRKPCIAVDVGMDFGCDDFFCVWQG